MSHLKQFSTRLQGAFADLSVEEQRRLAALLPASDRSDVAAALSGSATGAACAHFLRLLKGGLLEADAAPRWLPPREREPDRRARRCANPTAIRHASNSESSASFHVHIGRPTLHCISHQRLQPVNIIGTPLWIEYQFVWHSAAAKGFRCILATIKGNSVCACTCREGIIRSWAEQHFGPAAADALAANRTTAPDLVLGLFSSGTGGRTAFGTHR